MQASEQQRAAAAAYEDLHVPALFKQWAPLVLEAARIRAGSRVLDVACGTGVLAREAARLTGDSALVSGLDANPGMLAVAEELAPTIDWTEGIAESLPFETGSFDAVVSQFGLMFFLDRVAALSEMNRVLKLGGRVAVAVWDSLENSEAFPIEVELLQNLVGPEAADALRAPFVLGDKARLLSLFEKAGYQSAEIDTIRGTARFPSIRTLVEADLRGWLPVMGVTLTEDQIEMVLREAEQALRVYVTADGTMEFSSCAHIVSAQKNA